MESLLTEDAAAEERKEEKVEEKRRPKPRYVGNKQGKDEICSWEQTITEIVVKVSIPPQQDGALSQNRVRIKSKTLLVKIGDKTVFDEEELYDMVHCDASTWTMQKDDYGAFDSLEISLSKVIPGWWPRPFKTSHAKEAGGEEKHADDDEKESKKEPAVNAEGVRLSISFLGVEKMSLRCPNAERDRKRDCTELIRWIVSSLDNVDEARILSAKLQGKEAEEGGGKMEAARANFGSFPVLPHPDFKDKTWGYILDLLVASEEKRTENLRARQQRRREDRAARREQVARKKQERDERRKQRQQENQERVQQRERQGDGGDDGDMELKRGEEKEEAASHNEGAADEKEGSSEEEKKESTCTGKKGNGDAEAMSVNTAKQGGGDHTEAAAAPPPPNADGEDYEDGDDDGIEDVSDDTTDDVEFESVAVDMYLRRLDDHAQVVVRSPVLYQTPDLGIVKGHRVTAAAAAAATTTTTSPKPESRDNEEKNSRASSSSSSSSDNTKHQSVQVRTLRGIVTIKLASQTEISELKAILVKSHGVASGFVLVYPQHGFLHPKMRLDDMLLPDDAMLFVMPHANPEAMESQHGPWYLDKQTQIKVNRRNPSHDK